MSERGSGDVLRVPVPSFIWVHGRKSGAMMIDGMPDVRAAEGVPDAVVALQRLATVLAAGRNPPIVFAAARSRR
ncbi:MAG TPA: hypothetical protein VEF72_10935 [Mycobacterium sp.]|nr:hypothetical protein [Mycobacterium sp.]